MGYIPIDFLRSHHLRWQKRCRRGDEGIWRETRARPRLWRDVLKNMSGGDIGLCDWVAPRSAHSHGMEPNFVPFQLEIVGAHLGGYKH